MTQQKDSEKIREEVLEKLKNMSSKEIFEIAVHAKIYTPDGQLTEPYRTSDEPTKTNSYDSKADTLEHIQHVRNGIGFAISELVYRSQIHDDTKLGPEEKEVFDRVTPKLKGLTYGSEEYKASLAEMGSALTHHHTSHRHHPEYFGDDGFRGMNMIDILEMIIDWHASTKRHADGDIRKSIEINQKRFGYSDDVKVLLHNTADWLLSMPNGRNR